MGYYQKKQKFNELNEILLTIPALVNISERAQPLKQLVQFEFFQEFFL